MIYALFAGALAAGGYSLLEAGQEDVGRDEPRGQRTTFLSACGFVLDTVFTSERSYLDVDLDSQRLYHRRRDGRTDTILISTGNPALTKGIETHEGIFLIQNKIDWLYSLQFDSTKVFNWLGFNFGIGFHSLETRGYYRNLGKRPSSHGCIRVGAEDAARLFREVDIGTPVLVHHALPARVIAFAADTSRGGTQLSKSETSLQMQRRLSDLLEGTRLFHSYPPLTLSRASIGHTGIGSGNAALIPARQIIPPLASFYPSTARWHTRSPRAAAFRRPPAGDADEDRALEQTVLP